MGAPISARWVLGAGRLEAPFAPGADFLLVSVVLLITGRSGGRLGLSLRTGFGRGVPGYGLELALHLNLDRSLSWFVAGGRGPNKKPTTVASRGFLSKSGSTSTRADGIAAYDDYQQNNLSNCAKHRGGL
ncbi:MAG: hypothetical protein KJ070_24290 [Verrucomicrobia bacterium]|nr:hypothetical protein [Verrucomicrobiota bacterium]